MRPLSRRHFAQLASASLCAAAAAGRPNVILILADDQAYADLSAHGHPEIKTPHLDRLHAESVRFTDFHAAPMCTPTRAQLMTGLNCLSTGAMNVSSGRTLLRRGLPTLPEAFRAAGYRTGLFGKWHLGDTYPYRPQDRGFDESVWYASSHIGSVPDPWDNDYFNDIYHHGNHWERYSGYSGDVFFREAMGWIREGGRAPFFVYLPLNVAHGPLFVPPEYLAPYAHLPRNIARYSAMIANIDANAGRLETFLRENGLRENTIVIYCSDNGGTRGTNRFNAGRKGFKTELWEGGHRVPCLIRWPAGGVSGGRDIPDVAQMQDLFPTLADLCGLKKQPGHGVSLAGVLRGQAKALPDRTAIVQFSRMPMKDSAEARPRKNDAAVMWKQWRLVNGDQLYDLASDPGQERNVFTAHPEIVARLQKDYDAWWATVEPRLDQFEPVVVGAPQENPVLVSACEWADVFVDQGSQVRRGERKNGVWHVEVARAGEYEIALRRWPREVDVPLAAGLPAHQGEDGEYAAGVAIPIAAARLRVGAFDATERVSAGAREAVFRVKLPAGRTTMQSWFLDAAGAPLLGAYYAYVERRGADAGAPVPVLFDTDIMGDVDDVAAVALLHALADRGEARVLAMGVSSKHADSPRALAALNAFYRRPAIPIGVNSGEGFLRDSKYASQLAAEYPHAQKSFGDAVELYRRTLAAQPDGSVVLITVGQLTNISNLLKSPGGRELARRKVKQWVCMGAHFPAGREANIWHDAAPARHAVAEWPGRIVFSGFEIGNAILSGGRFATLPEKHPARRAYELYNGGRAHKSWDQTAVLYGVRCLGQDRGLWTLSPPGVCEIDERGRNTWREVAGGRHRHLLARRAPAEIGALLDELMTH